MGMDVVGEAPRSVHGEEFHNTIWRWHPLAEFCQKIAPEVCGACKHWHSNDGDGLDNDGAIALSLALQASVNTNVARVQKQDVENIIRFIAFLRDSGGFKIF